MRARHVVVAAALVVSAVPVSAQLGAVDLRAEEAAIRALIDRPGGARTTSDAVYWTGRFPRPLVGVEDTARVRPFANAESDGWLNQRTTTLAVVRLDVAAAGDMAYEVSHFRIAYELADRTGPQSFTGSRLRVWRKIDGEWRVVALFQRPHDRPFGPLPAAR